MKRKVWQPSGKLLTTDNSAAWQSNVKAAMEASAEARYNAAFLLLGIELTRQLDRIANALEKEK